MYMIPRHSDEDAGIATHTELKRHHADGSAATGVLRMANPRLRFTSHRG